LTLDSRFAVSNPAEDDGFLRAIKIRSSTSSGAEVKPLASCRKVYGMLKIPEEYDRYFTDIIKGHFSPSFSLLRH
jgi:hypothetical protein